MSTEKKEQMEENSDEDLFVVANETVTPPAGPSATADAATTIPIEDDAQPPPESVDLAADTSAVGKVKAMFGMLSKFIGVKDIVNMQVSTSQSSSIFLYV
jgi:hypothetical protein